MPCGAHRKVELNIRQFMNRKIGLYAPATNATKRQEQCRHNLGGFPMTDLIGSIIKEMNKQILCLRHFEEYPAVLPTAG